MGVDNGAFMCGPSGADRSDERVRERSRRRANEANRPGEGVRTKPMSSMKVVKRSQSCQVGSCLADGEVGDLTNEANFGRARIGRENRSNEAKCQNDGWRH
jgi:hypothetical protein